MIMWKKEGPSSKVLEAAFRVSQETLVKNFKEETFKTIQTNGNLRASKVKMILTESVNSLIDQGQDPQMNTDFYDFEI